MRILFENWHYLLILLAVIAIILLIHFISLNYTKKKALKFANFEAIERVFGTQIISKNLVVLYLRLAVVFFIFVALAHPIIVYSGNVSSSDFVIAIDASSSMLANDVLPNRLAVAKDGALGLVDNLAQAKVGVISFSGISSIEQAPTRDKESIKRAINNIVPKEIEGTDLSGAIITSANMLKNLDNGGSIILLTDGQSNVGYFGSFLNYTDGIKIYAISIGTKKGGEFIGNLTSEINEENLMSIANYTEGKYYHVESAKDLKGVYSEIASIKKGDIYLDMYLICMIIAVAILLLEWILANTKYRTLP